MALTEKEKAKKKAKIQKGMPYTQSQLEAMHFTDLGSILGILKVNPFKLKDMSIKGKINAILVAQKGGTPEMKKDNEKKTVKKTKK